jgi:hypothetical protein
MMFASPQKFADTKEYAGDYPRREKFCDRSHRRPSNGKRRFISKLLARARMLIRRVNGASDAIRLTIAHLTMDLFTRKVMRPGLRIDSQPREFGLLEYLVHNARRVVSKTMIGVFPSFKPNYAVFVFRW